MFSNVTEESLDLRKVGRGERNINDEFRHPVLRINVWKSDYFFSPMRNTMPMLTLVPCGFWL